MSKAIMIVVTSASCLLATAQSVPTSDPQALTYAAQTVATLTGGANISDVTLTGTVVVGGGADTGTATLQVLGGGESRMDLVLSEGIRTEIRDSQTGIPRGEWKTPENVSGSFASHNCLTDAAWFYPALGSLNGGSNVVISYVGQETRNGLSVQHLRSYRYSPGQTSTAPQQLSTMNFYLDARTTLPVSITFNTHSDTDASTNLLVEIRFSNYQNTNGAFVPMHIQKYQDGSLTLDLNISSLAFNSGLQLSNFTIN